MRVKQIFLLNRTQSECRYLDLRPWTSYTPSDTDPWVGVRTMTKTTTLSLSGKSVFDGGIDPSVSVCFGNWSSYVHGGKSVPDVSVSSYRPSLPFSDSISSRRGTETRGCPLIRLLPQYQDGR